MTGLLPESWDRALDEVAGELLSESGGWDVPPVDAIRLAAGLRIAVAVDGSQHARGRLTLLSGRSSIFLKPDDRRERMQWAAAHELGEVVAWRVFAAAGEEIDAQTDGAREQVANLFAARLLLPREPFFSDVARLDSDLPALKEIYRTASHELIAGRLLDQRVAGIVTIFDQGRLVRRRSNQGGSAPRLQAAEQGCQRAVHHSGEPARIETESLEIRGWPVHEAGWKREILYTRPRGGDAE